jgi:protein-S-isoprenylcysteine O-methyltransferase Ste14
MASGVPRVVDLEKSLCKTIDIDAIYNHIMSMLMVELSLFNFGGKKVDKRPALFILIISLLLWISSVSSSTKTKSIITSENKKQTEEELIDRYALLNINDPIYASIVEGNHFLNGNHDARSNRYDETMLNLNSKL